MIELTNFIWLAAGGLAGCLHAWLMWRGVQRPTAWAPVLGMLRLGVVAAVLVIAAMSGGILAAAAGWLIGLVGLGAWFATLKDKPAVASTYAPSNET
jgi:hypothetical protein